MGVGVMRTRSKEKPDETIRQGSPPAFPDRRTARFRRSDSGSELRLPASMIRTFGLGAAFASAIASRCRTRQAAGTEVARSQDDRLGFTPEMAMRGNGNGVLVL